MKLSVIAFLIGFLVAIASMGQTYKNTEADRIENVNTYNQPELPINPELIEAIGSFIGSK